MIAADLAGGKRLRRQEAGSIISRKNAERDLLYVQPTNPDLHEAFYIITGK